MNVVASQNVESQSDLPMPVGVVVLRSDGKWLKIIYIDGVATDEWVDTYDEATKDMPGMPVTIIAKLRANAFPQCLQIPLVKNSASGEQSVMSVDYGFSFLHKMT